MAQAENTIRLNKVLKEFGIGLDSAVETLRRKGITIESDRNEKISEDAYAILRKEHGGEQLKREQAAVKEIKELLAPSKKDKKHPAAPASFEEEKEEVVEVEDEVEEVEEEEEEVDYVKKRKEEEEEEYAPLREEVVIKDMTSIAGAIHKPIIEVKGHIDVSSRHAPDKYQKQDKQSATQHHKEAEAKVAHSQPAVAVEEKAEAKAAEKVEESPIAAATEAPTVAEAASATPQEQPAAPAAEPAMQEPEPEAEAQPKKPEANIIATQVTKIDVLGHIPPDKLKSSTRPVYKPKEAPFKPTKVLSPEELERQKAKRQKDKERKKARLARKHDAQQQQQPQQRQQQQPQHQQQQSQQPQPQQSYRPSEAPPKAAAAPEANNAMLQMMAEERQKEQVKEKIEEAPRPMRYEDAETVKVAFKPLAGPKQVGFVALDPRNKDNVPGGPKRNAKIREEKRQNRVRIHASKVDIEKESKKIVRNPPHKKMPKDAAKKPHPHPHRTEIKQADVDKSIRDTMAKMLDKGRSKGAEHRREKIKEVREKMREAQKQSEEDKQILKLAEFVTANDLAQMMDVSVNEVIGACMNLGLMVSINQRLDAEAIALIAENFGHPVEFMTADTEGLTEQEADSPEDLLPRPPIVTVMGHVDHGKTSLLDNIRNTNVIAGEAGGITQHIGAYHVSINDRAITFLDTPGHEAFTAMRARGAKSTDVAIIVVAADDSVMPQTVEAINHAVAAGVPMIFAINKIDKPGANPDRIREQLSAMNYLVEDWGGKYQVQEISAKQGLNVDKLLEKVLLEADMLELKANPNKRAQGVIIESLLDKGRGYISRMLVQAGTMHKGDVILSGEFTGKVKAMFNERGQNITEAGPSVPVEILGLNGAPTAGETFVVMEGEREARTIANRRIQLKREQGLRTQKHITLDEIGRRLSIGNFKDLNIIVKADVDGSVEALTDSLLKLSNEHVQVNVIHKAVGAISESDVHLAVASEAIIIGFQVRPSASTRKLAEQESIEIRSYSVIYDAINEIKEAIEGMRVPEFREEIVCSVEVQQVYHISKVGAVAGCIVREGKITRNTKVRLIRDGIVLHSGDLASLKRFKEDTKEVGMGFECGISLINFNDIKEGDIIEGFENVQVKK